MKHLKAFTLIELLTVLILSSVIITMAYLAINNTQSQFRLFENTSNQSLAIHNFKTIFALDFANAELIKTNNHSLLLKQSEHDIIYSFSETEIIRKTRTLTTSFPISVIEKQTLLGNKPVSKELIDHLALTVTSLNDEIILKYDKEYSAKDLMVNNKEN